MKRLLLAPCLALASVACGAGEVAFHDVRLDATSMGARVEVGVKKPGGEFVFLYTEEFRCPGVTVSNGYVTVSPRDARGYYWDSDGRRFEVAVFDRVGSYRIFVSDNLESDQDGAFSFSKEFSVSKKVKLAEIGHCIETR
jgi:hypothetical protein